MTNIYRKEGFTRANEITFAGNMMVAFIKPRSG